MSNQDKPRIHRKPVPVRLPSPPRYDSDEEMFEERMEKMRGHKITDGQLRRNKTLPSIHVTPPYSYDSNPEVPSVPTRQPPPAPPSSQYQQPSNRPAGVLSQQDRPRGENDKPRRPLTPNTVRWPFLDSDNEQEPTPEFPAVPLPEAPLRRRGAIRRGSLTPSSSPGRPPHTPTDEERDVLSPLGHISRNPLSASQRRARRGRDVNREEKAQSWYPGDDEAIAVKTVLETTRPKR
ncbi:hypothetical protein F4781DRAFT_436933 [Annulohypoxylon bovei var. microspora]|nr:hypothetical protein F4781DRAFT_436933 [Annulohypoxylon bovei var. microspora]